MRNLISLLITIVLHACGNTTEQTNTAVSDTAKVTAPAGQVPVFNEDSAFLHVKNQVDFGPRVPGTEAHRRCHKYFADFLKPIADTLYFQNTTAKTFDGKIIPVMNIIASFNPSAQKRILLCAHWDTRPFADEDTKDQQKPIPGANDGASGAGVLLEVAAALNRNRPETGIDIVLFDAEDWGDNSGQTENSYCLGSQYWAQNTHVQPYKADFGILLDMVGAPNAIFGFEGYSLSQAGQVLSMVWNKAAEAGYDRYFRNFQRGYVTDDHYYVMKYTGIPVIDIIDTDPSTESRFGKYWHTHSDNMEAIDRQTLKAVGQTLLNVIAAY